MNSANILSVQLPVDWSKIEKLPINQRIRPSQAQVQAWGQICRTEEEFWVQLQAIEPQILAQEEGPLPMPCNDSCLEFFLRPVAGEMRYLNFEWNPKRCLYLGIGSGPADLLRIVPSQVQQQKLFCPEATDIPGGWQITFRIPYSFIRCFFPTFQPVAGDVVYGNFYKCGDRLDVPHYLGWNPITREGKYLFHTPQEFGMLCLL